MRAATHHQEHEDSIAIPRHKRAQRRATKQTCLQSQHQVFQCLTEELAWLKISRPWTREDRDYCDLNWISRASSSQAPNQQAIHVGTVTWNTIISSATCTELSDHLTPNITQTWSCNYGLHDLDVIKYVSYRPRFLSPSIALENAASFLFLSFFFFCICIPLHF